MVTAGAVPASLSTRPAATQTNNQRNHWVSGPGEQRSMISLSRPRQAKGRPTVGPWRTLAGSDLGLCSARELPSSLRTLTVPPCGSDLDLCSAREQPSSLRTLTVLPCGSNLCLYSARELPSSLTTLTVPPCGSNLGLCSARELPSSLRILTIPPCGSNPGLYSARELPSSLGTMTPRGSNLDLFSASSSLTSQKTCTGCLCLSNLDPIGPHSGSPADLSST